MKPINNTVDDLFQPRELAEDEYLNEADGLIYCSKCHTPRQHRIELKERVFLPTVRCRCQQEIYDKEEAERKHQEFLMQVSRLRANGLQDKSLHDYNFANDKGYNPEMQKAYDYVAHWEEMKSNSLGLLLWGDVGTGKSFFAGCIANALLDKGIPVLMTNFSRILNTLTGMYSDDRNQFIDSFNKYSLLIIDDLGIERSSEFALEQVFNVIDSRYRSKKPLIVTTNLTLDELKHPKDLARARIYDRVLERCIPLKINNQNIASALETLRDHMVLVQYQLIVNTSQQEAVTFQKNLLADMLAEYKNVKSEIKAKTAKKKELITEQKNCGIHFIRASKLGEQIATLTEDIEELKFQKTQLLSRLNCQDTGVASQDKKVKEMNTFLEKLEQQHITLSAQKEKDKAQFLEIRGSIAPENHDALMAEREAIRPDGKVGLVQKLYAVYKEKYRSETFDEANRRVDAELQEEPMIGTMSILLAVFACISILNMLGVSGLSTERTYFDRYKNNWDFLVTVEGDTYSEELLNDIRNTEDVTGCIVHRIVNSNTQIPTDYLSSDVQKLSLEKLNSSFVANEAGAYNTKVPIFILDDKSFAEYRGDTNDANVVAVNIIWDSVNSERTDRQYVPFLNEGKEIVLNVNGRDISVSTFADALPVLREELTQYALTLVMSESYYETLGFDLKAEETIYTLKMTDESKNDVLEERLQGMLETYTDYAFEGRVQELADEMQIQQGLRMIIYLFAGILTCIGLANIFASTLGQIHQRKREFARYFAVGLTPKGAAKILAWEAAIVALRPILLTIVVNIPLMAFMLDAGGITAGDFIAKRLPLIPAILLFVAVIGFVALAYYLGGKKICNMNLVEAIKDDTLML